VQLRNLGDGESVEIEIPRGSLWLLQPGAYDFETPESADPPARISVFEGRARFVGGAVDFPIDADREIRMSGTYPAIVTTQPASLVSPSTVPNESDTVRRYHKVCRSR
jgi:hypothetical protein